MKRVIVLGLMLVSLSSQAWHQVGHRVVAAIAYKQLNEQTKSKVNDLISSIKPIYPEYADFIMSASWPDLLAVQGIHLFTHWHYINLAIIGDGGDYKVDRPDSDNAVWAINQIKSAIKSDINQQEKARLVMFLIHITGDIHQPLHASEYYSLNTPHGDMGGNLFKIKSQNPQANNLHTLWDVALGAIPEDELGNPLPKTIILSQANNIMDEFPPSLFDRQISVDNPYDWAKESYNLALHQVYQGVKYNKEPTDKYIEQGRHIAKQQMALAGYRLAAVLNKLFN